MHVLFVSDCRGRAIRRTRAVLDSYSVRTSDSSWATPITQQALDALRQTLRRTATRQTAVACYVNDGRRCMRLAWIVGSRTPFGPAGHFRAGTTRQPRSSRDDVASRSLPEWVRIAAVLARTAGFAHDLGKASERFQAKLRSSGPAQPDEVRHEWLSMRLLQVMRGNGRDWAGAWASLGQRADGRLQLGDRFVDTENELAIARPLEAIDFLVVSHHGLPHAQGRDTMPYPKVPTGLGYHVRVSDRPPSPDQVTPAGCPHPLVLAAYWRGEDRLARMAATRLGDTVFWRAVAMLARCALIFADHTVSRRAALTDTAPANGLYANTLRQAGQSSLNQSLDWHLQTVGASAGDAMFRIARLMRPGVSDDIDALPALDPESVERVCAPAAPEGRFSWQNRASDALTALRGRAPQRQVLVLNLAGTGCGKTRMNLRAACDLARRNAPRVSIALNLRTLTLQTGSALRRDFGLTDDRLGVVIGSSAVRRLVDASGGAVPPLDDDENPPPVTHEVVGDATELPAWLDEFFEPGRQRAILGSPILVSTIDYLIAAGEPDEQGHHVRALLRVLSADLILDEIDGYDPESLVAVLRLVQIAAMAGRNVVCSSATLSLPVAMALAHAWSSGLMMRAALSGPDDDSASVASASSIAMIDDRLPPSIVDLEGPSDIGGFQARYVEHLARISQTLLDGPIHRLAECEKVQPAQGTAGWTASAIAATTRLHEAHRWSVTVRTADGRTITKSVSFGLVRVANISHAIDTAEALCEAMPKAHVACYHSAHLLLTRFRIEQALDRLLSRQRGDAHIALDDEVARLVASSSGDTLMFVVVATPVEEIGRDHDFDWAVIDASSAQSIVQCAGRVNRHRLAECNDQPNIRVLQFNRRHCGNEGDASHPAFIWPGYERPNRRRQRRNPPDDYGDHDLATLLPWDADGRLVIDARIRFDTTTCRLAACDDQAIAERLKPYFGERGVFAAAPFHAWTLTSGMSGPFALTPLRSRDGRDVLLKRDLSGPDARFLRLEQVRPRAGRMEAWLPEPVECLPTRPNAWLRVTDPELLALCEEAGIDPDTVLRVTLSVYRSNEPEVSLIRWTYDPAFGFARRTR